MEAFITG